MSDANRGRRHRQQTPGKAKSADHKPKMGHCFVHTVIDDHSRVAYAEIHDDEKAVTAAGVLQRATAWFADRGITVARVISDNGGAYRSHVWRETCGKLGITPKWTRPYRPQSNGRLNGSTARWPTGGPTPSTTCRSRNAETRWAGGCRTTITTVPIPRAEVSHR